MKQKMNNNFCGVTFDYVRLCVHIHENCNTKNKKFTDVW